MCADIGVLISQSSFAVGEGHSIDLASRIGNNGVSSPPNTLIAGLAQSMARKDRFDLLLCHRVPRLVRLSGLLACHLSSLSANNT